MLTLTLFNVPDSCVNAYLINRADLWNDAISKLLPASLYILYRNKQRNQIPHYIFVCLQIS